MARLSTGFNLHPRLLQSGFALLSAGDFFGNAQPVLQRSAVGLLGFGQQFFDLPVQLPDGFARMLVADGGVLAGVGHHLGPIHGHGNLTDLQKLQRLRQFQHPHKGLLQQRFVLAPEGANGVMVRMGVRTNHPHRHTVASRLFDAPRAENSGGIAVKQ